MTPMYVLQAQFSMGGIRGAIQFLQRNKTQMLEIKVQFDQFSGTADFGIYSSPMIYNGNAQDSCNSDIVGSMITNGNLTAEHGPMTYKMTVNNGKLKAYGRDGIYGEFVKGWEFVGNPGNFQGNFLEIKSQLLEFQG